MKAEMKGMNIYIEDLNKQLKAQGFEIVYANATRSPEKHEQV